MSDDRRSIFITGAASGIGAATARRFARGGWLVGCHDANAASLDALEQELGTAAGVFGVLDVTDHRAFARAVDRFADATGDRLDLLYNNAGIIAHGSFDEMAWETIERIVRVNLLGVMTGIRAALPLLKATPDALCLSTCSASAIFGSSGIAAYSASKHGVRGLTEALSVEFARFDIRVADVLLGITDTAILSDETRSRLPSEGMWRAMSPDAVAEAVWAAYHDPTGRLHHYVPPELIGYEKAVLADPEAVRDEQRGRFERETGGHAHRSR